MKTKTTRRLVAALCLFAPFGKLRAFGLLAALSLFACALPARAVTITFNPATTATFLDVTLSIADGNGTRVDYASGWQVFIAVAPMNDGYIGFTSPNGFGFYWFVHPTSSSGNIEMFRPTRALGWANWTIADPVYPAPSGPGLVQRTWDVSGAGVPDGGATIALFALALLGVFAGRHGSWQRQRA